MTRSSIVRFALCAVAVLSAGTPAFGQANHGPAHHQALPIVPSTAAIQGFSVVLVLGSLKGGPETFAPELPSGAKRALGDMTDFLPYRSYRLLDSAWILNPGSGRVTSRLRGPDNRSYDVSLDSGTTAASTVTVKFRLRDGGGDRATSASDAIATQDLQAELRAEVASLEGTTRVLEAELAALVRERNLRSTAQTEVTRKEVQIDDVKRRLEILRERQNRASSGGAVPGSVIIDTGFTMNTGETVVVGTSRLQGDTALIVLLTAVPRGSK